MSPGTHELPLAPDRSQAVPREINVNGIVVGRVFTSFGTSAYAWNLTTGTNDFLPTFTGDDMHKEEFRCKHRDQSEVTGHAAR